MLQKTKKFVITTILGGVLIILPLAILFMVVRFSFNLIATNLRPIIRWFNIDGLSNQPWVVDFLSIVLLVLFCFGVGLFVRTQFGKNFFSYFESRYLSKLPLYSTIKETITQFTSERSINHMKVVIADVFGNQSMMTGFVTDTSEDGLITVFVPTGPNPTNGMIFHLPPERIQYIDVKPQDAMKTIIGVGTGSSELIDKMQKTLK